MLNMSIIFTINYLIFPKVPRKQKGPFKVHKNRIYIHSYTNSFRMFNKVNFHHIFKAFFTYLANGICLSHLSCTRYQQGAFVVKQEVTYAIVNFALHYDDFVCCFANIRYFPYIQEENMMYLHFSKVFS